MTIPLINPHTPPTAIPLRTLNQTGKFILVIRIAEIIDVSATIDPTLKSIPPVIITMVIPMAIIAIIED